MTTINEVSEAVKAVIVLKDTVAKHDQLIEAIADKLDQIYVRLDRLEALTQKTSARRQKR